MRVISDRKDYYDSLLANDEDRETIWVRKEKILNTNEHFLFHPTSSSFCSLNVISAASILFCGEEYRTIKIRITERAPNKDVAAPYKDFDCYKIEDVDKLIKENFPKDFEHYAKTRRKSWKHWKEKWCGCHNRVAINNFLHPKRDYPEIEKTFTARRQIELGTPIVAYVERPNEKIFMVLNPSLKEFTFQKVFPPYQAYQFIRMWLSNLAQPNKPIPPVSNSDMIVAKGFDLKTSFRKPKDK